MTETFIETPAEPEGSRLQLLAAILLGIAATLTAVSAYQAALLDGEALQGYSESSQALSDANYQYSQANQIFTGDQQLFVQYATSAQSGDADLTEYLTTLMRPELNEAVLWWQEDEEAITPFDDVEGNPYVIEQLDKGEDLSADSDRLFEEAVASDEKGDKFELAAVLLALTLFFGGIATLFRRKAVSVALLSLATVTLVGGGAILATAFAA